eukprot:jgi/Orpsp1_1/1178870/evm.model.c7180000067041.1
MKFVLLKVMFLLKVYLNIMNMTYVSRSSPFFPAFKTGPSIHEIRLVKSICSSLFFSSSLFSLILGWKQPKISSSVVSEQS